MQQVADALDRALVDIRERRAQERGDLDPERLRAAPEHRQDGALDGGRLLGGEAPLPESGQLNAEEGVSVLYGLGEGAGQQVVQHATDGGRIEVAHDAQEASYRALMVARGIGLERRSRLLEERLAARHREQRELQESQRTHGAGMVQAELRGNRGAAGVTGDVGGRHREVVQEGSGVGGVNGDGHRPRRARAADPAPLVVADQLVPVGQRRLGHEGQETVGEDRADEEHRLARADHLVLQLDAVDRCDLHGVLLGSLAPKASVALTLRCVSKTVTAVKPMATGVR